MPRNRPVAAYSSEAIGVAVYVNGALADPDGNSVTLGVTYDTTGATIIAPGTAATRQSTGLYAFTLNSAQTAQNGDYTATWSYTVGGSARTYVDHWTITGTMPYWDLLSSTERQIVLNVYARVSDTWDSKSGGPYLWELYQTQWNPFETISRIMSTEAMNFINLNDQPQMQWQVGASGSNNFPYATYPGLVEEVTAWRFFLHLSRSYIEVPSTTSVNVPHLDRTAYRNEWKDEAEDLGKYVLRYVQLMKRDFKLGIRNSLLIGGGAIPMFYVNPGRPNFVFASVRY